MLAVCREFQILFNETREKALKAIAFSKTLRKALENGVLKEGISPQCNAVIVRALEELKVSGLLSLQLCSCAVNSFWADSHSGWSSKTASQ
jgi:hypothetical protein